MNTAQKVIDKFGSQTALAEIIGKGQSTVAHWAKTGVIPAKWHGPILDAARSRGISLSPDDLIFRQTSEIDKEVKEHINSVVILAEPQARTNAPVPIARESFDNGPATSPFLFYSSADGNVKVWVLVEGETVWATQQGLAEIFDTTKQNISYHLSNIFNDLELRQAAVVKEILTTASDGKKYATAFYNLDAIISIGYRVNSYRATQFRKWATEVIKGYLIKGYALNDDRLKQGAKLFAKDYFDELLERIREIRASERRFYQKITDIYAQCSIDYDKDSPITQQFYAQVQDKLHYAIHGHTSAELIATRADATKPHMGVLHWKNEGKKGKVTKSDVLVGKNYLTKEEIESLDRLVSMYLDFAENFARRNKALTMKDWAEKLDDFLEFNAYKVLDSHGKIKREHAERHAIHEYEKFRVIQDIEYKSDFDKVVDEIKVKKTLPKSEGADS